MNALKIIIAMALFVSLFDNLAFGQRPTPPASGSGTQTDPYVVFAVIGESPILGNGDDYYWSFNGQPIIQGGSVVLAPYFQINNAQTYNAGIYSGAFSQGGSVFYKLNVVGGTPAMPFLGYVMLFLLLIGGANYVMQKIRIPSVSSS